MTHTPQLHISLITLLALTLMQGCEADSNQDAPDTTMTTSQYSTCSATDFEADAMLNPPTPPEDWPEMPPGAVIAMTYLAMDAPASQSARFGELVGPIIGELSAPAPGLLGMSTTTSERCATARTLTAWESEEAMMMFVMGDAHIKAITDVGDVSRGGSITQQWRAEDVDSLEWKTLAKKLAEHDGPVY